jgi:diketogulonate reductase-like aldo/keto reductase
MIEIPAISINDTFSIPKFGLGTWEMGGRMQADYSEDKKWISAIETALHYGIRHIDTAEMYGNGHCEELVGQACQGIKREELFINTKVSGENLQFDAVLNAVEKSLKRLQMDFIDLYLLHWPNPAIPLPETMKAINRLLDQGIIRSFGLSNFPVNLMREVMQLTPHPIITNQLEYNLFTRNNASYSPDVEKTIMPFCIENGISITAWRPLLKGDAQALNKPILASLSKKYGKTPAQMALNWLLHKPMMVAIPKMSSEKHIVENLETLDFEMDADDYLALDCLAS